MTGCRKRARDSYKCKSLREVDGLATIARRAVDDVAELDGSNGYIYADLIEFGTLGDVVKVPREHNFIIVFVTKIPFASS